jgi:hypothetical protein
MYLQGQSALNWPSLQIHFCLIPCVIRTTSVSSFDKTRRWSLLYPLSVINICFLSGSQIPGAWFRVPSVLLLNWKAWQFERHEHAGWFRKKLMTLFVISSFLYKKVHHLCNVLRNMVVHGHKKLTICKDPLQFSYYIFLSPPEHNLTQEAYGMERFCWLVNMTLL